MEIMTYADFHSKLMETFHDRFALDYPEAFTASKTKDKAEYERANKSMYSFHFKIMNSIPEMFDHWKYNIEAHQVEIEGSFDREKMIEDCKNSENVILWAFENIKIR